MFLFFIFFLFLFSSYQQIHKNYYIFLTYLASPITCYALRFAVSIFLVPTEYIAFRIITSLFSSFAHASRKFHIRDMRLFPFGSHVKDIYNGSLETLGRVLRQSELRFVAYYAPWCAQSRKMVPEMGLAADLLKETVSVDWNSDIPSFQVLFALYQWQLFWDKGAMSPPGTIKLAYSKYNP